MKHLFVCHTQYNLILSVGLSTPHDDLVLFKDFNLTDELKKRLEGKFERCMFLAGNFPKKELTAKEKLEKITIDNQKLKTFIGMYDRIFIVDDMCIQEMYALKCAYSKNPAIEMSWLEDGAIAYFNNGVISRGMGSTPLKRIVRKLFFSVRFNLFGFYDLASCIGGHKRLSSAYVVFPDNIRPELRSKKLIAVTDEQFLNGMKFMYAGEEKQFAPGSVLIAMDKLDVYGDKLNDVNGLIETVVYETTANVYYKYHPRETEILPALKKCKELERTVALESYLTNANTKELTVIGIKSTALQTAKKMGFQAVSYISQIEQNNAIVNFYKSIGVECR